MDINNRKKQFTQEIISDIKSKIKEFKSQKEHARSERNNELDFVINKDLINKFRKDNTKIDSPLPSSKNSNDTSNNQQLLQINYNNSSSINKNEQINNKLNLLKRHFSQESNSKRNNNNNNNNKDNKQAITSRTKTNEIIQSLIPKPKPYIRNTKYQINNNNNINQISFLKLHSEYNNHNNNKHNNVNSQQQNTSFHKDNKLINYTTFRNDNKLSINKDINMSPYIIYKNNLSSSKLQPTKFVNTVTESVLNRLSNSHSKQMNKELKEFSDFSIGSSSKQENYSKGKSTVIYTADIKPLLTKIKSLNNEDIKYIDKNVFDDLITLANVIKMKFNY